MRKAIMVLGMHRSGTSALTGTLVLAGAAAPRTLMEGNSGNERGHFESVPFINFHNELLAAAGTNWRDWRPFPREWFASAEAANFRQRARALLAEEFCDAPLLAIKDPRICRFAPFWFHTLEDSGIEALVVIPFRQPNEVAASHAARDGMSVVEGLLLWLRHVLDAERDTRGIPRSILALDDLLVDWRAVLAHIERDLGLIWPSLDHAATQSIETFLSWDLKHQNEAPDALVAGWAARAFDALRVLANDSSSRLAQNALDAVAAEFEQACALFGPLVSEITANLPAAGATPLQEAAPRASVPPPARLPAVHVSVDGELAKASRLLRRRLENMRAQADLLTPIQPRSNRTVSRRGGARSLRRRKGD